jgi:hypothetical protein
MFSKQTKNIKVTQLFRCKRLGKTLNQPRWRLMTRSDVTCKQRIDSLLYDMIWYDMVWYGMVWYGMVWYGMVWYGMVWVDFHSHKTYIHTYRLYLNTLASTSISWFHWGACAFIIHLSSNINKLIIQNCLSKGFSRVCSCRPLCQHCSRKFIDYRGQNSAEACRKRWLCL